MASVESRRREGEREREGNEGGDNGDTVVKDALRRLPILGDAGLLFPLHARGNAVASTVEAWACEGGTCSNRPVVAVNYGFNAPGDYILHDDPEVVAGLFSGYIEACMRPGYLLTPTHTQTRSSSSSPFSPQTAALTSSCT